MASIDIDRTGARGASPAARRQPFHRPDPGLRRTHFAEGGPHAGAASPVAAGPGIPESGTRAPGRAARLVQTAGALTSLALIGGLAWWGYELAMRDVRGIPVVRALEGPLRIQPDDPGGQLAEYEGLAVNRIQAEGSAAPAPDRLVLAPRPVDVLESDPPGVSPRPRAAPLAADGNRVSGSNGLSGDATTGRTTDVAASGAAANTAGLAGGVVPAAGDPVALADAPAGDAGSDPTAVAVAAAARAVAEQVARDGAALSGAGLPDRPGDQAGPAQIKAIPASVPGVTRAPRPPLRPARVVQAAALIQAAARPAPPPAEAAEIDPASLPPGTSLAQLGAFDSAEVAQREWQDLTARFPEYFTGKARIIQEADTGGRRFYRLRVHGFKNHAAARRFCSALLAENAVCVPITTR